MVLSILKSDIRHNYLLHFAIASAIALLVPVFVGISSLKGNAAAQPVEMFLTLTGAAALTPVFLPEQDRNIRDVIRSKKTDCVYIYALRAVYSAIFIALMIGVFAAVMRLCESETGINHFAGGFASALFLGTVGFAIAGLSENTAAGYMAAFIYYMANFALKEKLGVFFLFSMSLNGDFSPKLWQLLFSAVIMASVLIIKKRFIP